MDELDNRRPERSWDEVSAAAEKKRELEQQTEQIVADRVTEKYQAKGEYDRSRLTLKETLLMLTEKDGDYEQAAKNDKELTQIIGLVRDYAKLDTTAVSGDYGKEVSAFRKLCTQLDAYLEKQEALQRQKGSETQEALAHYRIATELTHIVAPQRFGALDLDKEAEKAGTVKVNGVGMSFKTEEGEKQQRFPDDQPLFPHDPSPDDIAQGYLGDCYLLAGLSTLASLHPEKIKENICDNRDGTVTVRFFQKQKDKVTGEVNGFSPVLVTVDKIAPTRDGAQNCLWAQMIERAYVAAGLHLDHNPDAEPVPNNLEELYQQYLTVPAETRPGHDACPWLFTQDDQLTKWAPDYTMIESGSSGQFLEQFLGTDAPFERYEIADDYRRLQESGTVFLGGDDALERAIYNAWEAKPQEKGTDDMLTSDELVRAVLDIRDPKQPLTRNELTLKALIASSLTMLKPQYGELIEHHPGEGLSRLLTDVKDFLSREREKCPAVIQSLLPELTKPEMQECVVKASAYIDRIYRPLVDRAAADEPYRGKYPQFMEQLRQRIDHTIENGGIVNAGTPGTSDRDEVDGIYGRHAYSVLGTVQKKLSENMPELTFVRLRNPHGRHGREYYVENNKVKQRATEEAEGGVFLVELSDFCREFKRADFTDLEHKLNLNAPRAQEPGANAAAPEKKLEGETFLRYAKELRGAYHDLVETKKGMPDFMNTDYYRKFEAELYHTLESDLYGSMKGRNLYGAGSSINSREAYNYMRHCDKESKGKPLTGRRAERYEVVIRLQDLREAMKQNYEDPSAYARDTIAERIYSQLRKAKLDMDPDPASQNLMKDILDDPEYRKASIETIKESEAFRSLTENAAFKDLSAMMHNDAKTYRKFLEYQAGAAVPRAEQPAHAPERARNRSSGGPQR